MPTSVKCPACSYMMVLSVKDSRTRVNCEVCGKGIDLVAPAPDFAAAHSSTSGAYAAPSAASGAYANPSSASSGAYAAPSAASGAYASPGRSRSIEGIMEEHLRTIRHDMMTIRILIIFTFVILALILVRMTFFGVYARFAASPY